jgi:hypothetical protein
MVHVGFLDDFLDQALLVLKKQKEIDDELMSH